MTLTPTWLDLQSWPYTPRTAQISDGQIHYTDEGTGPATVLVHGTPTWSFEWRHVIAKLRATRRVLALDHLGFGLSERPTEATYSPEAHARRFGEWMALVCPAGKVDLVVHDFGGPIALRWAVDSPHRLRSLTVVNSWMWSFQDDPAMQRAAKVASGAFGKWLYGYFNASQTLIMPSAFANRKNLTKAAHLQYLSVFPDRASRVRVLWALAVSLLGSSDFFDGLWRDRSAISEIPVHVLWGMKDSAFKPALLARWLEAFPTATEHRFDESGHWPHEEQPEEFASVLAEILGD